MKILPSWIRDFVDIKAADHVLAEVLKKVTEKGDDRKPTPAAEQ